MCLTRDNLTNIKFSFILPLLFSSTENMVNELVRTFHTRNVFPKCSFPYSYSGDREVFYLLPNLLPNTEPTAWLLSNLHALFCCAREYRKKDNNNVSRSSLMVLRGRRLDFILYIHLESTFWMKGMHCMLQFRRNSVILWTTVTPHLTLENLKFKTHKYSHMVR